MEQLRVLIARVSWDSGVGSALALTFFFINTPEASHIVCASSIPQEFATPLLKGGIAAVYRQVIQHVVGVAHDRMQVSDHRQESPQLVATSPFAADQTLPRHDFSQCSYQRVLPVSVRPVCWFAAPAITAETCHRKLCRCCIWARWQRPPGHFHAMAYSGYGLGGGGSEI